MNQAFSNPALDLWNYCTAFSYLLLEEKAGERKIRACINPCINPISPCMGSSGNNDEGNWNTLAKGNFWMTVFFIQCHFRPSPQYYRNSLASVWHGSRAETLWGWQRGYETLWLDSSTHSFTHPPKLGVFSSNYHNYILIASVFQRDIKRKMIV